MKGLVHTSSIWARHSLTQCKILHRTHYTNAKLLKIYPERSDSCNRCNQLPADHMLMFWSEIFNMLGDVLRTMIDPDPLLALFGVSGNTLSSTAKRVIAFTTLLARRLILFSWTNPFLPTHNRWIHEILHCIKLEKIRFSRYGSLKAFNQTWQPFLDYIDLIKVNEEPADKTT